MSRASRRKFDRRKLKVSYQWIPTKPRSHTKRAPKWKTSHFHWPSLHDSWFDSRLIHRSRRKLHGTTHHQKYFYGRNDQSAHETETDVCCVKGHCQRQKDKPIESALIQIRWQECRILVHSPFFAPSLCFCCFWPAQSSMPAMDWAPTQKTTMHVPMPEKLPIEHRQSLH